MEVTPQTARTTAFRIVKKGYDPDEVEAFKGRVADAIESSQEHAAAMEARARAAVAKLQESTQQAASPAGDVDSISRTLVLAQRTADAAVAEARAEAERIVADAKEEAGRLLDAARTMSARTIDEARVEARRAADDDRRAADNEVQQLLARRDFLLADVDQLEQFLVGQRIRLRDAASEINALVERVPAGLGDMRRPLMSASAESGQETPPAPATPAPAQPVAAHDLDELEIPSSDIPTGEMPAIVSQALFTLGDDTQ
jgi:DivIVA domain-containing protein